MPKFVVERSVPDAGNLTADELQELSKISCEVIGEMGPQIQWINSYVTGNKIYCVYVAPDEAMIREHAIKGGFDVAAINEIFATIDPSNTEQPVTKPAQ